MRQHLRSGPDRYAFFQSPLNVALTLAALFLLSVLQNGYIAYRFDHLSQIPLLFIHADPDLFPRDWFYQNFGHFKLRFAHVALIQLFSFAIGIPLALLVLYFFAVVAVFGAWMAISRRLYGTMLPGVVASLLGIFFYGEIGSNHLIERILIPRAEAYAVVYWGVYFLVCRRPIIAGILFGISGWFQPAVCIQFAIPLLIWIPFAGYERWWRVFGLFMVGMGAVLIPWLYFLRSGFEGGTTLTDAEVVHIVAWLRHPVLMLPRFFGESAWAGFFLLVGWAMLGWRRFGRDNSAVDAFGKIVPILAGLLLLSIVFVEIFPIKWVVMFQPFRVSVFLYFLIFLLIAPYLVELLQSPNPYRIFRGGLLIMASGTLKLFVPLALIEAAVRWRERRGSNGAIEAAAIAAISIVAGFFIEPEVGGLWATWRTVIIAALLAALMAGIYRRAFWSSPARVRGAAAVVVAIGFFIISAFFWLPLPRWLERESLPWRDELAQVMWKYQLRPAPIQALERVGAWAQENTEKNALFVMPPERSAEGFRIWSHRSVVFNSKHFPVTQAAYKEWRRRYLIHRGVLYPETPEDRAQRERVLADFGGGRTNEDYADLELNEVLAIVDHYAADYFISPTQYDSPRLEPVVSAADLSDDPGAADRLIVYRVVPRAGGLPDRPVIPDAPNELERRLALK